MILFCTGIFSLYCRKLKCFALVLIFLFPAEIFAQIPANDNFSKAEKILIGQNGYGKGSFSSKKINITKATKEAGESFHLLQYYAGTDKKTAWFAFETKLRRNVSIELWQQDTMISQDAVGLTVYRTKSKNQPPNLGEVDGTLTPISKFGSTSNSCLAPDIYYIQVSAKQNANGEIWINLVVDDASPAPFDHPNTAYNFGTMSGTKELRFESGCQGIEDTAELKKHLGKDFNQTAWFTFTTDNYSDMLAATLSIVKKFAGPDTASVGYFLYKGDAKNGLNNLSVVDSAFMSVGCNPTYSENCGQLGLRRYLCKLEAKTTYSIQLYFHKNSVYDFLLRIDEQGEELSKSANPKNLPAAYQLGKLQNNKDYNVQDHFACNSHMSKNLCGEVNQPEIIPYESDTYNLSLWFTFEVPASGVLHYNADLRACNMTDQTNHIYRFYKGDVTKNCSLKVVFQERDDYNISYRLCLEPGVYSMQILGKEIRYPVNNICRQSDLGKKYNARIRFVTEIPQTPAKHYTPENSLSLGKIDSLLYTIGVKSEADFFGSPDTSFVIDKVKYSGRFVFRRFYIGEEFYLSMRENGVYFPEGKFHFPNKSSKLFHGDVSLGLDTLKLVNRIKYGESNFTNEDYPFISTCTPLPPGWYTVVSILNPSCQRPTSLYGNELIIHRIEMCKKKFNQPYKAHLINNGEPLKYGSNTASGANTDIKYIPEKDCFGCQPDTLYGPLQCRPVSILYDRHSYYVFYLDKPSLVHISGTLLSANNDRRGITYSQLYKGNVRTDSTIIKKETNRLHPCTTLGEYCNLQPGYYTIVYSAYYNYYHQPEIRVERNAVSLYDHASSAANMGYIDGNNIEKISPSDYFYCTTGAYYTDPDTNMNSFYYSNQKNVSSVPYPMPENARIFSTYNRRNLWYSFTCSGTGNITATVYPRTKGFENYIFYISVYKSDEKGNLSLTELKSQNKIDSTHSQGLTFITRNYGLPNIKNNVTFGKLGCDTARYYIIIDRHHTNSSLNNEVQVGIKYEGFNDQEQESDYCTNAKEVQLSTTGTKQVTALINCHTTGESYGEDGSNMACLVRNDSAYKTSWFKFKYTGNQKVDLSFKIIENSTANATQIRYRVLYGTCNAMTAGPCVENSLSSFKLDCMGPGEYFVQVVTPANTTGTLTLEATATPTAYQICKPVNLLGPVANFSFTGGCNNAPVEFINLSTAGSDIDYLWDFGNGKTSTEKAPIVQFNPVKAIDTFYVTLWVTNTYNLFRDSLVIPVLVFKDPVKVILAKKIFELNCMEKAKFKASSNYSFANYEWFPKEGLDNPYSAEPVLTSGANDAIYKVRVKAENCVVEDSLHIYMRPKMLAFGDTIICPGNKSILSAPTGYNYYLWSTNRYGQTLEITEPGKYWVRGHMNNGCFATDTITVYSGSKMQLSLGNDTAICASEKILLKPNKTGVKYIWSTGDTTVQIWVNKQGKYWLQLQDTLCQGTDTIEVTELELPKKEIPGELIMCDGKPAALSIYAPGEKYLWSTGSTSANETFTKQGIYWVTTTFNSCSRTDSFTVKNVELPTINLGKDTFFCGDFALWLDAGDGAKYHWQPINSNERKILANSYGRYTVSVYNKEGCENRDSITINEECDPQLWVPNAFTPGNDSTNNIFKAVGQHITHFEMNIFNRWGELIFRSTDINFGWDGSFKNQLCQVDAYLWTISYRGKHTVKHLNGLVYLLK